MKGEKITKQWTIKKEERYLCSEVQNDILNEKDEIQELEDVNRFITDMKIVEMFREEKV